MRWWRLRICCADKCDKTLSSSLQRDALVNLHSVSFTVHFYFTLVITVHDWFSYVSLYVDGCMTHSSRVYYPSGACGVRGFLTMPNAPLRFHLMRYWHCRCLGGCMVAGLVTSFWHLPYLRPKIGSSCNASCIPWHVDWLNLSVLGKKFGLKELSSPGSKEFILSIKSGIEQKNFTREQKAFPPFTNSRTCRRDMFNPY